MKLLDLQIIRVSAGRNNFEAKYLIKKMYEYGYSWAKRGSVKDTYWDENEGRIDYIILENLIYFIQLERPINKYTPDKLPQKRFIERLKKTPIY